MMSVCMNEIVSSMLEGYLPISGNSIQEFCLICKKNPYFYCHLSLTHWHGTRVSQSTAILINVGWKHQAYATRPGIL